MDKITERIKADAEAYVAKTRGQQGRVETYIAGATAKNERAQKLVDALEEILKQHDYYSVIELAANALQQWKGEKESTKEIDYMPIHPEDARKPYCPRQFPMHLLDEQYAQRNHGQTLKRLKERGGLGVLEILSIVNKKPWSYYRDLKWDDALRMLNDILADPTK